MLSIVINRKTIAEGYTDVIWHMKNIVDKLLDASVQKATRKDKNEFLLTENCTGAYNIQKHGIFLCTVIFYGEYR